MFVYCVCFVNPQAATASSQRHRSPRYTVEKLATTKKSRRIAKSHHGRPPHHAETPDEMRWKVRRRCGCRQQRILKRHLGCVRAGQATRQQNSRRTSINLHRADRQWLVYRRQDTPSLLIEHFAHDLAQRLLPVTRPIQRTQAVLHRQAYSAQPHPPVEDRRTVLLDHLSHPGHRHAQRDAGGDYAAD